jgi:hypothetical protein
MAFFDSASEIADEPFWFAVQVKATHEKRVASLFDYKRYEWFLPLYGGRRRWSDRIKLASVPRICLLPFRAMRSSARIEDAECPPNRRNRLGTDT